MSRKARPRTPPVFRLGTILRLRKMTKRQLAQKAGITLPMVYRLSKARANPTWEVILRLCKALDCSPGDFRGRVKR